MMTTRTEEAIAQMMADARALRWALFAALLPLFAGALSASWPLLASKPERPAPVYRIEGPHEAIQLTEADTADWFHGGGLRFLPVPVGTHILAMVPVSPEARRAAIDRAWCDETFACDASGRPYERTVSR